MRLLGQDYLNINYQKPLFQS